MIRQVEATHAWMESLAYQTMHMPAEIQPIRLVRHNYDSVEQILIMTVYHQGGPIALCKAQSTQTFEYCAREAAQIFGGLAYTRGGQGEKVERLYREVRGKRLFVCQVP